MQTEVEMIKIAMVLVFIGALGACQHVETSRAGIDYPVWKSPKANGP